MKATGIVRKIDGLGRIVLPKELRGVLDLDVNDPVEIFTDGVKDFKGKDICSKCRNSLK